MVYIVIGFVVVVFILAKWYIKSLFEILVALVDTIANGIKNKKIDGKGIITIVTVLFIVGVIVRGAVKINTNKESPSSTSIESSYDEERYATGEGYEAGYKYLSGKYDKVDRYEKYAYFLTYSDNYLDTGLRAQFEYKYKEDTLNVCTVYIKDVTADNRNLVENKLVEHFSDMYGDYTFYETSSGTANHSWKINDKKISIISDDDSVLCLLYSDDIEWIYASLE